MKRIFFLFPFLMIAFFGKEIDIEKGITYNFTNLLAKEEYIFYLKVFEKQTVNISYIISYDGVDKPFSSIDYIECYYKNRSKTGGYNIIQFKNPELKNNQLLLNFSQVLTYYIVNYLSISMIPYINISYFSFKAEVDGGAFNLTNNIPKTLYNLTSGNIYSFFIPAKWRQNVSINLTMNRMDLPFDSIDIYEQPYRDDELNSERFKLTPKIIEKNKQIQMSVSFQTSLINIVCIQFFFKPKYDIKYLSAQIKLG